jgi:hypothetical protein
MSHSKVYKQREGNQPECKRWKQNLFGPFDGTIVIILSCRNYSSVVDSYTSFFVTIRVVYKLFRHFFFLRTRFSSILRILFFL